MKNANRLTEALGLFLPAVVLTLLPGAGQAQSAEPLGELVLLPFLPAHVRVAMPIPAQVLIYNPREDQDPIHLEHLEVSVGADVIGELYLDHGLVGGREYGEIQALIERLPYEITENHRPRWYFADAGAPEFAGPEIMEKWDEVSRRVRALRDAYESGLAMPFVQPFVTVPLDQIFLPAEPAGTRATLRFSLRYRTATGARATASVEHTLTWLGAAASLPTELTSLGSSATVHVGDMHVHSCYGEAWNACGDGNCYAETLQVLGSFTYADLKPQFQSIGMDWFTATEHSYCVNSTAEFAEIQFNAAAVTDFWFVCIPDLELSSDEAGPQTGNDVADAICGLFTPTNHMGAHGIHSRIEGGYDELFGFCDNLLVDALDDFRSNIAQIRGQGGYPVVNHPIGGWGWNSYDEALGIESNALHGVEIWNTEVDGSQSGQGGNVGRWVDWLLDGRILYAYAGSDTHNEANAIGANYAVIPGETFDRESLESSLRGGRVYISNGPALSIEVDAYGQTLFMGARHAVPYGDPSPTITVRTAYHFGSADTGSISFYSGRVGDPWGEIRIIHQTGLTGSGTISTQASLTTDYVSWYRAYLEVGEGAKAAYTNPVFFVPSYGNDHCANATPLYGDGVFAVDNTAGTGLDADPGCASMGSDVWYKWTAAATGTVTMDMCDGTTNYDSALAAWEGPSGCPTNLITCNDDLCGFRSQVTFACTIGTDYMIQVGGWNGATGTGTLTVNTDGGSCTDTIYCTSLPNSTGTTASLSWSGSCAVADNNFTLNMAGGPASQPGLFIYSASQASNPFGNGILCLSGTINRLNPPIFMDGAGTMSKFVDLANPPSSSAAITAGSTWHFQAWYRDATGGGAGYNLSDGLEITFAPGPYEGMVLVPGGTFEMGRHVGSGDQDETPLHTVSLDAFYMDGNQVSIEKYVTYLNNALARGEVTVTNNVVYQVGGAAQPLCDTFWSSGCSHLDWDGSAFSTISGWEEQPINLVSWYGACAYANGRSRDNGLTPCYDESDWSCDFTADGYRLPTEAEWEYAARGGEHNPYYMYPWGDSIDGSKANYLGSGDPYESDSPATTPVGYYDGSQTPAGVDMANGHGLYDAVGNVREWCWDWYDSSYYSNSPSNNPTGPTSGSLRVGRGGGSNYATPFLRSAYRDARPPTQRYCTNGLGRVVAAFP